MCLVNGGPFVAGPYFRVKQRGASSSTYKSRVYRTDSRRPLLMELARPVRVAGDVKVEFYDGKGAAKVSHGVHARSSRKRPVLDHESYPS